MNFTNSTKPLKRLTKINGNVLSENTPEDYEIEYVDISNVSGSGKILGTERMNFGSAPSRARRLVRHGDTIVSTVRTYLRAITSIRNPAPNLVVSTGFATLTPFGEIDGDYFAYLAQTEKFIHEVVSRSTGVSYPAITPSELGNIKIDYPPRALQRRIAAFLDRETANIDTLVAEKESLLRLLEEKRTSLISQAVTRGLNPKAKLKPSRIPWLGEVPEHWEVMKLRYLASHVTSGSRGWSRFYSPFGDKFIRIGNLRRGSIKMDLDDIQHVMLPSDGSGESAERARLRMNDVLFSITAYLGSVGICPAELEGAYVSQHVALVRLNSCRILSTWLGYYALGRSGQIQLNEASYGGTKLQLSLDDIREFTLPVPPIDEQRGIVDFLEQNTSNIDSLVADIQTSIHLLREKRTSLISAAVTGG